MKKEVKVRKIITFLGLKRSIVAMLLMSVFMGLGERLSERFLPIYLIALGGSAMMIGLLNWMDNFLGAVYSVVGGYLSDRLGYKRALNVFTMIAIPGYLLVILIPQWWAVLLGAVLFISWTAISTPASMTLVHQVLPEGKKVMGVSLHSMVRRIPMALGPIIGGVLISTYGTKHGIRWSFVLAIILALLSLIVQQRLVRKDDPTRASAPRIRFRFTKPMRHLLVSDILIRYCEQIPYAFVVVWVVTNHGINAARFGILTAIEMVTALLIYIPVATVAARIDKKKLIMVSYVMFTFFPVVIMVSSSFTAFVIAFVVRGLKEFGEPSRKSLIMELAPAESKATSFGAYYFLRDTIVSFAALGGAYLWRQSPVWSFVAAAGFGGTAIIYFLIFYNQIIQENTGRRIQC
ncbi:MAG: MFS transporter [Candidatus Cloacimonetes bacterium]|nr:MFS transporter [Candidatus Cloacimonadota bacterium]